LNIYFYNIGSNAGSNSSSTFSINTYYPNLIEFSNVFKKLVSLNLVTYKLVSFPNALMNLFAYPCGSIINGHLLQLNMNIPLSIDKLSAGNPASYHSLIVTSSANIRYNVKLSETGIYNSLQLFTHFVIISYL